MCKTTKALTLNLDELMKVLGGTDFDAYEQYKKKYFDDKVQKFLDGSPLDGERVCYMTFMRSGNTFLRKYLELITMIPTGTEMHAPAMPL